MIIHRIQTMTTVNRCCLATLALVLAAGGCAGELDVSDDPATGGSAGASTGTNTGTNGSGSGGDGDGGSGGSGGGPAGPVTGTNTSTNGSGPEDASSAGDSSGAAGAGGEDDGSYCFRPPADVDADNVCAPTCPINPLAARGAPCAESVTGEAGICVPFFDHLPSGSLRGEGICSVACDPLAPDCPENFACSLTEVAEDPSEDEHIDVLLGFACLPLFRASPVGSECNGWPGGDCAAGSECIPEFGATCRAYCDSEDDETCPDDQICEKPEYFPAASTAGICMDRE